MALNCHLANTLPWRNTARIRIGGSKQCLSIGNRSCGSNCSFFSCHHHSDDSRHPRTFVSQSLSLDEPISSHLTKCLKHTATSTAAAHCSSLASPRPCRSTTFPSVEGSLRCAKHHYHPVAQGALLPNDQPYASHTVKGVHFHSCNTLGTSHNALRYYTNTIHPRASENSSYKYSYGISNREFDQPPSPNISSVVTQFVHQASNVFSKRQRILLVPQHSRSSSQKAFTTSTEHPPSTARLNTSTQQGTNQSTLDRDGDENLNTNATDGRTPPLPLPSACPGLVVEAVQHWASVLQAAAVPEPLDSARHITAHVLACHTADLEQQLPPLTEDQLMRLDTLMTCRLQRMPVQYIIGEWDFHEITLELQPPVFIPRPETELLVDHTLTKINEVAAGHQAPAASVPTPVRVLELCCGSGAISLALLHASQQVECVAVDMSGIAVALAGRNAAKLGLQPRLSLVQAKVERDVPLSLPHSSYDIIVANPPYILGEDLQGLAPEIVLYEDLRALSGGRDGLSVIQAIVWHAARLLQEGGQLLLEVDPAHKLLLPEWLAADEELRHSFTITEFVQDLNGNDRFIFLEKSPGR